MAPRATDPAKYDLHVVKFSVVREPAPVAQAPITAPEEAAVLARQLIPDDAREHFWVLLLNTRNALVAAHEVSVGTLSASLVSAREVFGPALRVMGVASLILLHNHPSGDPTPSREDLLLTKQLVAGSKLLDLKIHDHVIVGNGTGHWLSLAQRGAL